MNMEIDRKELKAQARETMGLTQPKFWLVALVMVLLTEGVQTAFSGLSQMLPANAGGVATFLTILVTLYVLVVRFGFDLWSLWTSRRLDPGMGSLLQGFSVVDKVLWMEANVFLRVLGWAMLCSMAASLFAVVGGGLVSYFITVLAAVAVTMYISLKYSMAPFILADYPDDGGAAAVHRSVLLTKGWCWELAKLELSFLGWHLLVLGVTTGAAFLLQDWGGILTLLQSGKPEDLAKVAALVSERGLMANLIAFLATLPIRAFLEPYRSVARAGFYDERLRTLRQEQGPLQ